MVINLGRTLFTKDSLPGGISIMKQLLTGNEAAAEAAIQAGCRYYYGYPITPQNELINYMSTRMPEVGGAFIQAESEIAAISMVHGSAAAAAGDDIFVEPGISLKQEGISYLAGSELPCVIVNIQRGGPGLGDISASQADYFQAVKGGGHGDYHTIVLAPCAVQEMADLVYDAFDLADKYRIPVMILGDAQIGQLMEPVEFHKKPKKIFGEIMGADRRRREKEKCGQVILSCKRSTGRVQRPFAEKIQDN